ncbi:MULTISPECIES: EbsA family protein [Enterococcus]|uniref:EbsA protein n=1 Tax=Candidatus Enterococcus mangumiae TaxID=2230878 RepID=A0ABZ2SZ18_9ENTE|nr:MULTISPECIES: EbsA family protein [unclassified Enterococcus]MBO0462578.1 EbsA family protein [Enterococcus sp. DIV1298c]MBO0490561.1 EbsA family protein [Enterococcus sp. DIV1094]MBO1301249.1 EbsA family protein [Enterococcus sp. DIV1271a]
MKKNIRWQPETAQSIIYWSSTFIILFLSLILSLENTRPYWKSNIIMGVFFVFLLLGLRRSFVLKKDAIRIKYAAFWRDRDISIDEIKEVRVQKRKVSLSFATGKEPFVIFVNRKAQQKLLEHLKHPMEEAIKPSSLLNKTKDLVE